MSKKRNVKKIHYQLETEGLLTEEKKLELLKNEFSRRHSYKLNIDNPQTYNEKIIWLKLYNQDPRITRCCDKYTVKGYVEEKLGPGYTVPTIAQWDNPDDIDFDALPNQFVLKVNWSSGYNIIVKDKSKLDKEAAKDQLKRWMKPDRNSYYQYFNWGYKNVKPVCYAEEYIEQLDGQLYDYKFLFSKGKLIYLLIVTDRLSDNTIAKTYFDENFEIMPIHSGHRAYSNPELPKNLDRMLEKAKTLADDFPLVRVDFYEIGDEIKIGEMTFYCGGGMLPMEPVEWDYKLGAKIQLPEKKIIVEKPSFTYTFKKSLKKARRKVKRKLKALRRKIIHKDGYKNRKFLVFLGIRIPYTTHVEDHLGQKKKYINILGLEFCYKKAEIVAANKKTTNELINTNTEFTYTPNSPTYAFSVESKITPEIQKIHCEQKGYKQMGYFPNIDNPKTINEKIIWLALNYKNPEIKIAADKSTAKEWVANRIGREHVVPLIGVYENVNDIDFDTLPDRFVAKLNAGWGADKVMIVRDKSKLNIDKTKAIFSSWLYPWNSYYYYNMCITDEKKDRVCIVIEEFLDAGNGAAPDDYKFYCCNGEPKYALVVGDRNSKNQTRSFVDMDWNILPVARKGKPIAKHVEKPECLDEMKELARKLSEGFPFVRVDFYQVDGKVYLGEMTFTPGMFLGFSSKEWDRKLGDLLELPEIEK